MNSIWRKFNLYILSLALLFVFLIILNFHPPASSFNYRDLREWRALLWANSLTIFLFLALIYCILAYSNFKFNLRGATNIPFEITKIEGINYEHLIFLSTHVVPLMSFNFSSERQATVFFLLIFVMGAIYIKTDLFYANPSLALLGFHIYRVNGSFKMGVREGIILISQERLLEKQKVLYIKLDDRIYYAKGKVQ